MWAKLAARMRCGSCPRGAHWLLVKAFIQQIKQKCEFGFRGLWVAHIIDESVCLARILKEVIASEVSGRQVCAGLEV